MRELGNRRIRKALKGAAVAEIQAVAIYDAECFWIRDPARLAILERIRAEEIEHSGFLSEWVEVSGWEKVTNQIVGRVLGSALACLPWKTLCRVQAWAEAQASAIYFQTLREIQAAEPLAEARLIEGLREAANSEARHAVEFRVFSST